MVVIRKNGKMVVYFNSTNKQKNNSHILSPEQSDDETELDDFKFREWQKNLVKYLQVRTQKNGELVFNSEEQKRIRRLINSDQKR